MRAGARPLVRAYSRCPEIWALLVLAAVFGGLRGTLVRVFPIGAVLGSVVLYLLPGAALCRLLGRGQAHRSRLEWLAHSFAASFVLLALPTLAVILLSLALEVLVFAYAVLTGTLVLGAVLVSALRPERYPVTLRWGRAAGWLLRLTPYVMAVMLAWLGAAPVQAKDDWFVLGYIQDDLVVPHINAEDPFFNAGMPMHPRYRLSPWLVEEALLVRFSGLDAITWYNGWIIVLVVVSVGAYYAAARELLPSGGAAAFAVGVVGVYLITTIYPDQAGWDFLPRIAEDKMVARYILMPMAFAPALAALRLGRRGAGLAAEWREWTWLLVMAQALGMIHPEGVVFLGLPLAGCGLLELYFVRRRETAVRLILVAAVLLSGLVLPVAQFVSATGTPGERLPPRAHTLNDARDPLQWAHLSHSFGGDTRLWLYADGSYSVHPSRFLKGFAPLAYLGVAGLIFRLRRNRAARLFVGAFLLITVVLLFPPTARLLALFLTPWLLHRLAWPLDSLGVPFVLAWGAWALLGSLERGWLALWTAFSGALRGRWAPRKALACPALRLYAPLTLLFAVVLLSGRVRVGIASLTDKRLSTDSCPALAPLFQPLARLTHTHTGVLVASRLSTCVPGYAPYADVVAYQDYGTIGLFPISRGEEARQRVEDAQRFSAATRVDQSLLDSIARWQVGYLVLKADAPLETQLRHLPELFERAAEGAGYVIYAYRPRVEADVGGLIAANSLLSALDAGAAADAYEELLEAEDWGTPGQRYLAWLGLGQARVTLGDLEGADVALEAASRADPDDAWAHIRRAEVRTLAYDCEGAARAYRRAVELRKDIALAWQRLGDAHQACGRSAAALEAYQAAASAEYPVGSSRYEQAVGDALAGVGRHREAIEAYERVLKIVPDSGALRVTIGQQQVALQDWRGAERALHSVTRLRPWDTWSATAYNALGDLYAMRGEFDRAEAAYRTSLWLDPTEDYAGLASLWQSRLGAPRAVERLARLPGYRHGFIPALAAMADLRASLGDYKGAVGEIRRALTLDPLSADLLLQMATYQMTLGELDVAEALSRRASALGGYGAYSRLGDLALERGHARAALGYYWLARLASPSSGASLLSAANAYAQLGDVESAALEYRVAARGPLSTAVALQELGTFLRGRGDLAGALDSLETAAVMEPGSPGILVALGTTYGLAGRMDEARSAYQQAVALAPGLGNNRAALASFLIAQGELESALEHLEGTVALDPGYSPGHVALANLYSRLGRPQQARDVLEHLVAAQPHAVDGYLALGALQEAVGQPEAAAATYRLGLARVAVAHSAPLRVALGALEQRLGHAESAWRYFQAATEAGPTVPDGFVRLADWYARRAQWAQATAVLQRGLRETPGSVALWVALGDLWAAVGDVSGAEECYGRALELDPSSAEAHGSLAALHGALGRAPQARAELEAALAVWPGGVWALPPLASWQLLSGDPEGALLSAQHAITLAPGDPNSWLSLASVHRARGQLDQAQSAYDRAVALDPLSAEAWMALAVFEHSLGRVEEAEAALLRAEQAGAASSAPIVARGDLLRRGGHWSEAESVYRQAIAVDASQSAGYLGLAALLQSRGRLDEAKATLEEAIRALPADVSLRVALAGLAAQRAEFDVAEEALTCAAQRGACGDGGSIGSEGGVPQGPQPGAAAGWLALGQFLLERGRQAEAEQAFQRAVALPGETTAIRIALGDLYMLQGRQHEAFKEYQRAVDGAPGDPLAYVALADYYSALGEWETAGEVFARGLRTCPGSALLYGAQSAYLLGRGEPKAALVAAWRAVALERSAATLIGLGQAHEALVNYAEAEHAYDEAAALDRSLPDGWLALGSLFTRLGRAAEAEAACQAAVEAAPASPEGYLCLAAHYQAQAQPEAARVALQAGESVAPATPAVHVARGEFHALRGQVEQAEQAYQMAIGVAPGDISGHAALGQLYLSRGNWTGASAVFHAALRLAPADPTGYIGLAQVLQLQGQSDQALGQYLEAVRRAPASALAFRRLGDLYRLRGQVNEAEQAYRQATLAAPGDPAGYTALAALAAGRGDRVGGRLLARQAIEVAPADPAGYLALAQVEGLDGDPSAALQALQAATQVAPVASAAHVHLGDWHWLRGEISLAERAFERAIAVAPADPDGYLSLGHLRHSQGRFTEALALFERAAAVAPAYVAAHIERGQWYEAQAAVQAAEEAYVDAVVVASMALQPLSDTQPYSASLASALKAWLESATAAESAPAPEGFTARFSIGDPTGLLALAQLERTQGRPARAERALLLATAVAPASIGGWLGLGGLYQVQGRSLEALAQFQAAVALAPTSAQAHIWLGNWHRQGGDEGSAEQEYRRAIAATTGGDSDALLALLYRWQEPTQPGGWVEQTPLLSEILSGASEGLAALGELELARRNFGAAAEAYSQTVTAAPLAATGYLGLARVHALVGNRAAAEEQLMAATRQAPGSLEAYLALGEWYAEQGRATDAEATYRHAQALAPGRSESLLALAALAVAQGDPRSARGYIQDALDLEPASPSAAIALGDLARAAGDYAGAEQAYRRAIAAAPGEASGYLALARLLERQGDRAGSERALEQAIAIVPTDVAARIHLAEIYRAQGLPDAAEAQLLRAAELAPISALPRVALGALYEGRGNREAALAQYTRAVALEADSMQAAEALAAAYRAEGRLAAARAAAEEAIRLNPGSAWPELLLGALLTKQGSAEEALTAYERAVAKEPANVEALDALGWAYHLRGRVGEAMTLYRRAVALQLGNPSAHLALARGYFAESEIEAARQEYEATIALDASAVGAYSALAGYYSARNQLQEALATYRRAEAAAPLDTAPILDGARVLGQLGDWTGALAQAQRAAELDSGSALPELVIGSLYRDVFDYGQAVQAFERGIAAEPGNVELYTSLASLFAYDRHRTGDEALAEAQRALALSPGAALAHVVMGEVLEVRFGNLPGAIAEYEQALRLDPRETDAYERIVGIYQRDLDDLLARYSPEGAAEADLPWIYGLIAHAYKAQDNVEACIRAYETMLTLVPDHVQAHCDVAALYERANRQAPALRHWGLCAALAAEGQGALIAESRRERLSTIAITRPSQGQVVSGIVEVWGSAVVPDAAEDRYDFHFYKVEIGAGVAPSSWAAVGDVVRQPLSDGLLAILDTTSLPNGLYTLRLTVVDNVGNTWPPAEIQITVQN